MRSRVGSQLRWAKRAGVAMTMTVTLVAGLLPASPAPSASAEDEPDDPDGLLPPGDWEPWQVERMLDLIADAEEKLPAFSDVSTLPDRGFFKLGVTTPGGFEHWYHVGSFFDEHVLDPEHPESLVFRRTATGNELVAVMLFLDAGTTMDDVPDELRWLPGWHVHSEGCVDELGLVVGFTIPGTNSCPPGSRPADGPPMVHVWIADNECGHRFAGTGLTGVHCDHGHPGSDEPGGSDSRYPSEGQGEAQADGSITVDSMPTGFGPGGPVSFPSGSEGVCNPDGRSTTLTAMFGDDHDGHVPVTEVEVTGQLADVVVTDEGAICGEVTLEASAGEIQAGDDGTGTFSLSAVTAEVEIIGTGVFEPLILAGCVLSLDIGDLSGTIAGDGPPNATTLSAPSASVAEAPDSCGDYGQLLDVGFALPSTSAKIELDLSIDWGGEDHDH